MARIIPLTPPVNNQRLVQAAWQFARAVLWAEQTFNTTEGERAAVLVAQHLGCPAVTEQTFITFCERILLAREAQLTEVSFYLGQPSVWLHPGYGDGYSNTQKRYRQLQQKRTEIPGYREEYEVLSLYYFRYHKTLRRSAFRACCRKLTRLKAFGLLSLLYRATIYSKFSIR